MKKQLLEYIIPHRGLKEGFHEFDFRVGAHFLSHFKDDIIQSAEIKVHVQLDNRPAFLHFDIHMAGWAEVPCDRCLSACQVQLNATEQLVVKWNEESESEDSNLLIIPEIQSEFDLAPVLYEQLKLNIPIRTIHEDERNCDQDTLSRFKALNKTSTTTDPRWEQLKNISDLTN